VFGIPVKASQEHPCGIFAVDALGQTVIHFKNYFLRQSPAPVYKIMEAVCSSLACLSDVS
jgi:hypothetical protein